MESDRWQRFELKGQAKEMLGSESVNPSFSVLTVLFKLFMRVFEIPSHIIY